MSADVRRQEVEALLRDTRRWAASREDLHAVALVGSWARDAAHDDSDVDLVLLTDAPDPYVEREEWIGDLAPGARLVRTGEWGSVVERRLLLRSSLEVEIGIARPSWARADPVDPGTCRVVRHGLRPVYDPYGLLAALAAAC